MQQASTYTIRQIFPWHLLNLFARAKVLFVFNREQATQMYASWTYGVAYLISELPYVIINRYCLMFSTCHSHCDPQH